MNGQGFGGEQASALRPQGRAEFLPLCERKSWNRGPHTTGQHKFMPNVFDDERDLPLAYRTMLMEETGFTCLFCGNRGSVPTLRIVLDVQEEFGGTDERDNLLVA